MSHAEQMNFVQRCKNSYPLVFNKSNVLEIGSYNVNGTVRIYFDDPSLYIGLDLSTGKDVDVVCSGHLYDTDVRFDVVISSECFEHDENWDKTFKNMIRLCKSGGLVIFTCASNNRPEHGTKKTTPSDSLSSQFTDYYKNLFKDDFLAIVDMDTTFTQYVFESPANDLYFVGVVA